MILKIKQRQHVYETKGGWKWDFIGGLFTSLLLTGTGLALLCWGLFGEPKAKPGRSVDIPPRTAVFLAAGVLIPVGLCLGGVSWCAFRDRKKIGEQEFSIPDIVDFEVIDGEHSSGDQGEKQGGVRSPGRGSWFTSY